MKTYLIRPGSRRQLPARAALSGRPASAGIYRVNNE